MRFLLGGFFYDDVVKGDFVFLERLVGTQAAAGIHRTEI
jgi:hypothetical protein